ncbi:MAG: SIS domain-containing protein [Christensenellales bacterium]
MADDLVSTYSDSLVRLIGEIDHEAFHGFMRILLAAYIDDRQVFVAGNGGSAATANHFVCDFGKNAVQGDKRRFRILSLADSVEKITALGNDIAFEEIFRQQLINLLRPEDVLILISASGSSPDLVRACEYARSMDARIVALAGFQGGKIKDFADVALVARTDSYERIEDIHLIILHMAVCYMKEHQELLS